MVISNFHKFFKKICMKKSKSCHKDAKSMTPTYYRNKEDKSILVIGDYWDKNIINLILNWVLMETTGTNI